MDLARQSRIERKKIIAKIPDGSDVCSGEKYDVQVENRGYYYPF